MSYVIFFLEENLIHSRKQICLMDETIGMCKIHNIHRINYLCQIKGCSEVIDNI